MVRWVVVGVGLVLLATACSMEGRFRRRGAYAVCDADPMVDPWLSRKAEARRSQRFSEAVFRGSAGTVATRPLAAAEVEALLGRVPIGYGEGVVVLEVAVTLAASSPSSLVVGPQAYGHDLPWRQPLGDEEYALFGTTPPPAPREPSRKTVVGGSLFVLTLGIVDIDDRWGSVTGGGRAQPSAETQAGRDAVSRMFMLELPKRVEPAGSVTRHVLLARTEGGTGPVSLELELEPRPGGCGFLGGRRRLELTVAADEATVVAFDGEDFVTPAW